MSKVKLKFIYLGMLSLILSCQKESEKKTGEITPKNEQQPGQNALVKDCISWFEIVKLNWVDDEKTKEVWFGNSSDFKVLFTEKYFSQYATSKLPEKNWPELVLKYRNCQGGNLIISHVARKNLEPARESSMTVSMIKTETPKEVRVSLNPRFLGLSTLADTVLWKHIFNFNFEGNKQQPISLNLTFDVQKDKISFSKSIYYFQNKSRLKEKSLSSQALEDQNLNLSQAVYCDSFSFFGENSCGYLEIQIPENFFQPQVQCRIEAKGGAEYSKSYQESKNIKKLGGFLSYRFPIHTSTLGEYAILSLQSDTTFLWKCKVKDEVFSVAFKLNLDV